MSEMKQMHREPQRRAERWTEKHGPWANAWAATWSAEEPGPDPQSPMAGKELASPTDGMADEVLRI
jgi:hypothetical protein